MGIILACNIYFMVLYLWRRGVVWQKRTDPPTKKTVKACCLLGLWLHWVQWSDRCNSSEWYNLMLNMNWGGNTWKLQSMELLLVILWWKKLRKNSVVNVEGIRCWKCSVGKMLPVMYALLIGKNGQIITQKKLGSCRGNMGKNRRRRKRCIIKNIIRGK